MRKYEDEDAKYAAMGLERVVIMLTGHAVEFLDTGGRKGLRGPLYARRPIEAFQDFMLKMLVHGFVPEDPLPMDAVRGANYCGWRRPHTYVYAPWAEAEKAEMRQWLAEWLGGMGDKKEGR